MKEVIFTSKLRRNAVRAYFLQDAPAPILHLGCHGRSVPPPPLAEFVYGPVNDSAVGKWLITLELIGLLTEEPILAYHSLRPRLTVDKIRL